jgi:predicted nucleotidyltransferase component of viral defense system
MKFPNSMSFKAKIKQIAQEKKLTTQQVQQSYLTEAFLTKLSQSPYKANFIIKGGYLIGGIVGIDQRATMDLDTTVKGFDLTEEKLMNICQEILAVPTEESFTITFDRVEPIRESDDYSGFRLKMLATFEKIREPISIDITTGDAITPREVGFHFIPIFGGNPISVLAYPIETVLAEKLETILSRGIATTRPRDDYDVYILSKIQGDKINQNTLLLALKNTMKKRGSQFVLSDYPQILDSILTSEFQQRLWAQFQAQYHYAKSVDFNTVITDIADLLSSIQ